MISVSFFRHLLCGVLPKRQACSYGNWSLVRTHGVDKAGAVLTVDFSLLHYSSESPRDVGGITESWLPWLSAMSFVLLIACLHATLLQSCLTLCDPMDCSPPGSSVHGTLQARILEWVAISFSRGSSWHRDRTWVSCVSCIGRCVLYH